MLFLYEHVLHKPAGDVEHVVRAKQPIRLPVVLSREEVAAVLSHLEGTMWSSRCCFTDRAFAWKSVCRSA